MGAVDAIKRDLAKLPEDLRESALAAAALEMGRMLDDRSNSATSKSMCAGQLVDTMERLRGLAPPVQEADWVDELAERKRLRTAGSAAT